MRGKLFKRGEGRPRRYCGTASRNRRLLREHGEDVLHGLSGDRGSVDGLERNGFTSLVRRHPPDTSRKGSCRPKASQIFGIPEVFAYCQRSVSTQEIHTIVLELRANNSGVDTRYTFFQTPVRVEDALGHVFPFPSECSIRALHAEIEARCNEGPVKNSVAAGDYAIVNPEDSDQVLDIRSCASPLPGMSLSMAIDLQSFFQLDCRQLQLGDCNIVVRVNSSRNAW